MPVEISFQGLASLYQQRDTPWYLHLHGIPDHLIFSYIKVLLRGLNKQVRHFTGSGNTPMIYSLKPVIEEVQTAAEEEGDKRVVKMCNSILKAIHSRTVDNYVAYRKVFFFVNLFSSRL